MDLNYLLIWIVITSCVTVVIRSHRATSCAGRGWMGVAAGIGVLTAILAIAAPSVAGFAGGALWFLFVLTPVLLGRWVMQLTLRQDYRMARAVSHVVRVLHPTDGWEAQPELLRGLQFAHDGQIEEGCRVLEECAKLPGAMGRVAATHLYRIRGEWREGLQRVQTWSERQDATSLLFLLRGFGETGDFERLVWTYARARGKLESVPMLGSLARLFLMAFCGRRHQVDELLSGPLRHFPAAVKAFWRATALTPHSTGRAREELEAVLDSADPLLQLAARHRLGQLEKFDRQPLSEGAARVVQDVERAMASREPFVLGLPVARRTPWLTYAIIVANLALFGVELWKGGTTDTLKLLALGAMFPPAVAAGEVWRLFTALWLHFGVLHLLLNMVGLYVLGPYVESALGTIRMGAIYLFSGLTSMAFVMGLWLAGHGQEAVVLGASGSIMGLVGAMAVVLWREWRRGRSLVARRRFAFVLILIAFQTVFDFVTPEVSFASHFSGVIAGCVLTWLLLWIGRDSEIAT